MEYNIHLIYFLKILSALCIILVFRFITDVNKKLKQNYFTLHKKPIREKIKWICHYYYSILKDKYK